MTSTRTHHGVSRYQTVRETGRLSSPSLTMRPAYASPGSGGQPGPQATLAVGDLAELHSLVVGVGFQRVARAVVDRRNVQRREPGDIRPPVLRLGLAADRLQESGRERSGES